MSKPAKKMAATKLANGNFRIPAILSFPHLFKPQAGQNGGEPKYGAAFIVSKDVDLSELEAAMESAKVDKWGSSVPRKLRMPIHDGSENDHYEGYDDTVVYFNARNGRRPYLVDIKKQDIDDPEEIYPGAKVLAVVRPFAYDNETKGVALSLQGVVKIGDGEQLGGKSSTPDDDLGDMGEEDFGEYAF